MRRGPAALLAAAAALGSVSVLVKVSYEAGAHPASLLAARLGVAAMLLTAAVLARRTSGRVRARQPALGATRCATGRVRARDLALGAVGGIACAGAGLLEFLALSRAPAGPVVVLVFVAPVWVAAGARLLGHTALGRRRAALIALVLAGTGLLVAAPGDHAVPPGPAGLALAASLLSAGFFVSATGLARELGPPRAAWLLASVAGGVALLAPDAGLAEFGSAPRAWLALAIGALTAGALCLLCAGLSRTPAVSGVAIAGVEPVVAALLAWVVLGEDLTALQLLGALIVVVAVLQIARVAGAAPLVEPDRGDEDDADDDVLPEALDPADQQPVREDDRNQHADHAARDRADAACQARPSDHDRRQGGDQLRGVAGRHAGDPEAR
jgi:DME family drug/metabolite transporter